MKKSLQYSLIVSIKFLVDYESAIALRQFHEEEVALWLIFQMKLWEKPALLWIAVWIIWRDEYCNINQSWKNSQILNGKNMATGLKEGDIIPEGNNYRSLTKWQAHSQGSSIRSVQIRFRIHFTGYSRESSRWNGGRCASTDFSQRATGITSKCCLGT